MNKKGQINIGYAVLVILIIVLVIIGIVIYINQRNQIISQNDLITKSNIEYQILKSMVYDYYTLPDNNPRNMFVNTKFPCWNNTRAFSDTGLIEYYVQCVSNITYVKIPIVYHEHETKFYLYNGTIIPVVLDALNKTK